MLQILLLLHLTLHFRIWIGATSIIYYMCYFLSYNEFSPIISIVSYIYGIMCCVIRKWHMEFTVEESCQHRKNRLSWLLNNRASDCWRIVQMTSETQNGHVNITSGLDFQITYCVQYQFRKVFPSELTKAWGGSSDTAHPTISSLTC